MSIHGTTLNPGPSRPRRTDRCLITVLSAVVSLSMLSCGGQAELYRAAQEQHERGDLDLAIETYRRALELDPFRAEVFADLGGAYYERGDITETVLSCEKALEIDPENRRAHAILARAYLDLGQARDALPHALRGKQTSTPEVSALWTLAATFLQLGRYDDAERMYRMTLEVLRYPVEPVDHGEGPAVFSDLDIGHLYFGIGLSQKGQGKPLEALAWYDSALVSLPDEPEVLYEKGVLLERRGKYVEALNSYRQAIRSAPFYFQAQVRSAVMLYHLGELAVARDILLSLYYDYEAHAEVAYTLGRIAERRGFSLEAVDYYREAHDIDDMMAAAWLREGLLLLKLGFESDGMRSVEKASERGSSAAKWFVTWGLENRPEP